MFLDILNLVRIAERKCDKVYCLGLVMRSQPCFLAVKEINRMLRTSIGHYTYVSVSSKMSSERNLKDGVHLSQHGVTNILWIIKRRILGNKCVQQYIRMLKNSIDSSNLRLISTFQQLNVSSSKLFGIYL